MVFLSNALNLAAEDGGVVLSFAITSLQDFQSGKEAFVHGALQELHSEGYQLYSRSRMIVTRTVEGVAL
jgi:hypothetical protein